MALNEGETLYSYYSFVGSVGRQAVISRFTNALKTYNSDLLYEDRHIGKETMDVVIFLCYPFDVKNETIDTSRKYSVALVGEKYKAYEISKESEGTVTKIIAEPDCFDPETKTYKLRNMREIWAYSKKAVDNYIAKSYESDRTARFFDNRHTFLDAVRLKLKGGREVDSRTSTGRILRYSPREYHLVPRHEHFFTKSCRVENEYVVFGGAERLNPVFDDNVSCSKFLKK